MTTLPTVAAGTGAITDINDNFISTSPAAMYARRAATTSGLTWGFYGGVAFGNTIVNGSVSLTASSTNYVVASRTTGAVSVATNTTNWNNTTDYYRLYQVVTGSASVSSYTDHRDFTGGGSGGGGASDFTDLGDVPASYTGEGGAYVRVKATEDGLEFVPGGSGGDAEDITYDPSTSGLSATDVQAAIDELAAAPGSDRSAVSAVTSTSGAVTIDVSLGDYFTLALSENITSISFSNLPGSGKGATIMLRITQDSTARTVAWPASFKWAGGASGSVSTAGGSVDVLAITSFDNGTTWMATLANGFA